MRYHEIVSGMRIPVSNEEQEILTKIGNKSVPEDEIGDERAQEVARMMMIRGLLNKKSDKSGKIVYQRNSANDIWFSRER